MQNFDNRRFKNIMNQRKFSSDNESNFNENDVFKKYDNFAMNSLFLTRFKQKIVKFEIRIDRLMIDYQFEIIEFKKRFSLKFFFCLFAFTNSIVLITFDRNIEQRFNDCSIFELIDYNHIIDHVLNSLRRTTWNKICHRFAVLILIVASDKIYYNFIVLMLIVTSNIKQNLSQICDLFCRDKLVILNMKTANLSQNFHRQNSLYRM